MVEVESADHSPYYRIMPIDLPLKKMSLPEKLGLLEALWNDLSSDPNSLQSPEWHNKMLADRRDQVASGQDFFSDWEDAKQDIRRRIS